MNLSRTFQHLLHDSDLDYDGAVAVLLAFTALLAVLVFTSI
jgi:hypothetical protein